MERTPTSLRKCLAVLALLIATTHATADDLDSYYSANGLLNRGLYDLAIPEYRAFLDEHGEHELAPTARYALGVCLFRLDRFEEATEELAGPAHTRGLEFAPDATLLLATSKLRLGESEEAARELKRLIRSYPDHQASAQARPMLCEALYQSGRFEEAVEAGTNVRGLAPPARDRVDLFTGLALVRLGNDADAADRFGDIIGRDQDGEVTERAALLYAQSLHRAGDHTRAAKAYEQAIERSDEQAPSAMLGLAQLRFTQKQYEDSKKTLDSLVRSHKNAPVVPDARLLLGRIALQKERYKDAGEQFALVARADREDLADDAAYWSAKTLLASGDAKRASAALSKAVDQHDSSTLRPRMMYDLGVALARAGELDDSYGAFARFRRAFPDHELIDDSYLAEATTAYSARDYQRARDASDKASRADDDQIGADALFLAADSSFMLGEHERSAREFALFLDAHSDDDRAAWATMRRGLALKNSGSFDESIPLLVEAASGASDDPSLTPALYALGEGYFGDERWDDAATAFARYVEVAPQAPDADDAMLRLGLASDRSGEQDAALGAFQTLRTRYPDSPHRDHALYEMGQVLLAIGKPDEAAACFEELIEESPESRFSAHAMRRLASIARDAGDLEAEAAWYARAAESGGEEIAGASRFDQAMAVLKAGRADDAGELFGRLASEDDALSNEARAWEAVSLSRAGDPNGCLRASKRVEDRDALEPETRTMLDYEVARSLAANGDTEGAIESYTLVIERGEPEGLRHHASVEAAAILMGLDRFDEALGALAPVLGSGNATPAIHEQALYRSGVCAFRTEDDSRAVALFGDFLDRYGSSDLAPSAHLTRGESLVRQGRAADAGEHFKAAAEATDGTIASSALLRLGDAQATRRAWDESEKAFREHARRFPKSELWFQAAFGIGWALENRGEYDSAIAQYERVTEGHQGPTAARAQFQIGECLFAQEKYDEAARALLKVDILYDAPEWSAAALYEAGRCFEQTGRQSNARRQYLQVIERFGDSPWAERASARLDGLQASVPGHTDG